jgi:hypothetical protein
MYAGVCCRMLSYAGVCWRMLAYAVAWLPDLLRPDLLDTTSAMGGVYSLSVSSVCWCMLAYAVVC